MRQDKDDLLFVVTEQKGEVAMLLTLKKGGFFMNEDAREQLQALWKAPGVYVSNMLRFIPQMAQQLEKGEIWVIGMKIRR
ncbi:MAG: hypothetical protein ACRYFX_17520 [Janthinobacterium lividum]